MFTGIVKSVGSVKTLEEDHLLISTDDDNFYNLETGTSISIDGCCLTLREYINKDLLFQISDETISRTSLNKDHCGFVNMELPLTVNSLLSGHIVQGHVDGVIELDEVTRQHQKSGILANASVLRTFIVSDAHSFKFDLGYQDIIRLMDGYDIEDSIIESYEKKGIEDTALIVFSNKRANLYNQQIRSQILGYDNEISSGDYIMVVKNNYYWLQDSSEAGFIANGDICEVLKMISIKDLYGFRFAEVIIRMIDYPNQDPFETVLLIDTLKSDSPSLSYQDSNRLYQAVKEDYLDEKSKYKQLLAIKKNKFFNLVKKFENSVLMTNSYFSKSFEFFKFIILKYLLLDKLFFKSSKS